MPFHFLKKPSDAGRTRYGQLGSPAIDGELDPGLPCSFCGASPGAVSGMIHGPAGVAICDTCLTQGEEELYAPPSDASERSRISHLYRLHFSDPRRERQFLASISFLLTFGMVRFIVRSIQEGKGPFHNVSAGGRHIHHLVWGILTLLGVGYIWLLQVGTGVKPPRNWMRGTAIAYGAGSALTLDEFALWLNLQDVYFGPEGRESIDAVVLFGSLLSVGFWGRPFIREVGRMLFHQAKNAIAKPGTQTAD